RRRLANLVISIGDGANDGAPAFNEHDDVQADVEKLFSGTGDDSLAAGTAAVTMSAGLGADVMHGGDGNDVLIAANATDKLQISGDTLVDTVYGEGGDGDLLILVDGLLDYYKTGSASSTNDKSENVVPDWDPSTLKPTDLLLAPT